MQIFKKAEWRNIISKPENTEEDNLNLQLVQTNRDIMRLTNDGKFPLTVQLSFKEIDSIFYFDPSTLELDEGETKEIKIWAFPNAVQEFRNTIIATIPLNPIPLEFVISCFGVNPTVDIDGPWTEAILQLELQLEKCSEKKQIKELQTKLISMKEMPLLDFDRILIGKSDKREFTIKNTNSLPVIWELNLNDFTDSQYLTISPLSGVLAVNEIQIVTLTFTSAAPYMLSGIFHLKFSDIEGGLLIPARYVRIFSSRKLNNFLFLIDYCYYLCHRFYNYNYYYYYYYYYYYF